MKRYLVIGNPIEHSLSPKLHNFGLKIIILVLFMIKKNWKKMKLKISFNTLNKKR